MHAAYGVPGDGRDLGHRAPGTGELDDAAVAQLAQDERPPARLDRRDPQPFERLRKPVLGIGLARALVAEQEQLPLAGRGQQCAQCQADLDDDRLVPSKRSSRCRYGMRTRAEKAAWSRLTRPSAATSMTDRSSRAA